MTRNKRNVFSIAMVVIGVQLIAFGLYQYHQTYGFDSTFNPALLVMWIIAMVGIAGIIGKYLNWLDTKKGYCVSEIAQEQIDPYKKTTNVGHVMDDQPREVKDREIREREYEEYDDTDR